MKTEPVPVTNTVPKKLLQKKLSKKRIPTLLGLLILIIALVAGTLLFKQGTGVFAPRAAPEEMPKNIKITNLTDKSFTVSFYTDEETSAFIKYGLSQNKLVSQASDDRDQLSGTVKKYKLHHITVNALDPQTTYYFTIGTSSKAVFDNDGAPFSLVTASIPASSAPTAKTIYGSVANLGGTPAEGSIVYISIENIGDLSTLVKPSGSWAIPLSNARTADGRNYATLNDEMMLNLFVQGELLEQTASINVSVAEAQPVNDIILGQESVLGEETENTDDSSTGSQVSADSNQAEKEQTAQGKVVEKLISESNQENPGSTASAILNLSGFDEESPSNVTTEEPIIVGQVIPDVEVKIEVHSDTVLSQTVTADKNGEFDLDFSKYGVKLEPGIHTVTYTYIDPETEQEVTRTQTFIVEDTSQWTAQASTYNDSTSYSSGSPYPMNTATPTPTLTPAVTLSSSNESTTKGGTNSVVATGSSLYTAGSVGTTFALIAAGIFFILTGLWSWWVASQIEVAE